MSASPELRATVFPLVVHQTYWNQGFFNVRVEFDDLVESGGTVWLLLEAERHRIEATINRSANQNGTARIMGGPGLRDWFQRHCRVGQTVFVDLSSRRQVAIGLKQPLRV